MTRRRLLELLGQVATAVLGVALAVPAAIFVSWPARKKREAVAAVEVAAVDRLPEGVPVRVPVVVPRRRDAWNAYTDVALGAAWLVRQGSQVRALSTVCPHAGCAVDWEAAKKKFECPCHGSGFSLDGARLDGPSPRAMDELAVQVKDGRVLVTWKRFRQGVPDKEPV